MDSLLNQSRRAAKNSYKENYRPSFALKTFLKLNGNCAKDIAFERPRTDNGAPIEIDAESRAVRPRETPWARQSNLAYTVDRQIQENNLKKYQAVEQNVNTYFEE